VSRDTEAGGLDDLFSFAPPPAPEPEPVQERTPSRAGWVIRDALLIAVATTVTVAGFRIAGVRLPILMIVAFFVALRLLMLATAAADPRRPARRGERGVSLDRHRLAARRGAPVGAPTGLVAVGCRQVLA